MRTTEIGLVFQGKTAVTRLSDQLSSEQGVALPRVGIFRLSAWGKKTNGCPTRWRRQRTLRRRKHGRLTATPALRWRRHATRHMTRHHRCITTLPWFYWTRCHPRPMMNLSTLWGPTVAACLPAHCRVLGSLSSPAIRSLQHASIVIRISTGKLCGDILHVSLGSCPCGNLVVSPALLSPKLHAAPPLSLRLLHPSSGSEMQSG